MSLYNQGDDNKGKTDYSQGCVDADPLYGSLGTRHARHVTERGREWQYQLLKRDFNTAFARWQRDANAVVTACMSDDISRIRDCTDIVTRQTQIVMDISTRMHMDDNEARQAINSVRHETSQVIESARTRLKELEQETKSHRSKSCSLRSSTSSCSRRADAAARAAVLSTKLKYMELQSRKQLELDKVNTEMELEMAKAECEAISSTQRLEQLTFQELETITDGTSSYVQDYVRSLPLTVEPTVTAAGNTDFVTNTTAEPANEGLDDARMSIPMGNVMDHAFGSTPAPGYFSTGFWSTPSAAATGVTWSAPAVAPLATRSAAIPQPAIPRPAIPQPAIPHPAMPNAPVTAAPATPSVNTNVLLEQVRSITQTFADQASLGRLPAPEPGVFHGDPLKYPAWRAAFDILISRKNIPAGERLYFLKRYVGGAAAEAVEGYFYFSGDGQFGEAMELLEKRYGNHFSIANAFRNKLDGWKRIPPADGLELRRFGDFLRQCNSAMRTMTSLNVLNDEKENKGMLSKLPDWLVVRWARVVHEWRSQRQAFPPFAVFATFVETEADIASDPVVSLQALRGKDHEKPNTLKDQRRMAHSITALEPTGNTKETENNPWNTSATVQAKGNSASVAPCAMCNSKHHIDNCSEFLSKSAAERKEFAVSKLLCFGCLTEGHRSKECPDRAICRTCSKKHPTALHGDKRPTSGVSSWNETKVPPTVQAPANANVQVTQPKVVSTTHLGATATGGQASMIVPVWLSHEDSPGTEKMVYALLDTQSDTSFILDNTCREMGLTGTRVKLSLSTMLAHDKIITSSRVNKLSVRGHNTDAKIELPPVYTREIMPAMRSHIPTPQMARQWPHLERLADELLPLQECEVGLLIGYNCSKALAPREVIALANGEPYALRTDLGWSIVGRVDPQYSDPDDVIGTSHQILACTTRDEFTAVNHTEVEPAAQALICLRTTIKEVRTPADLCKILEQDFSDIQDSKTSLSIDDKRFLDKIETGIHQTPSGNYEMPLPFRNTEPVIPNNKSMALRRLLKLKDRFARDQKFANDYKRFMQDMIEQGYAEQVPESQDEAEYGLKWYIPHHGVYNPRKPNKIRVVFDCSASFKGHSLNSHLLQGPDQMNALNGILCRFRQEVIAVACDVEAMFHQFRVNEEHRDYLRFLWWDNDSLDKQPVDYRMCVHLFGAVSSPACATFALRHIASNFAQEFGTRAQHFIERNFYVDDGLSSVPSETEVVKLVENTRGMCARGGLRLHKFVANSREVMSGIPTDELATGIKTLDNMDGALPVERVLGIEWCVESDKFRFRIQLKDQPLTRRGVLSTICSVYDPLGFIAPIVLVGKQILQAMCRLHTDWDDPLPDDLRPKWEQWRQSLPDLEKLEIDRCYKTVEFGEVVSTELHHFSDASTQGYGQCSYLRLVNTLGDVKCALVLGKARVTPLRAVTIPRLELTAALLSIKASSFLHKELDYRITNEYFWTDSQIVLAYIANESRRFHVFVANRVEQIRSASDSSQWHYVATEENPADDASRGLTVSELRNDGRWIAGPAFLQNKELSFTDTKKTGLNQDDPEVRARALGTHLTEKGSLDIVRLEYFSDWFRARRAVAVCLRFKTMLRDKLVKKPSPSGTKCAPKKGPTKSYTPVSVEETRQAELIIIRQVQLECFGIEIQTLRSPDPTQRTIKGSSPIHRLDAFLDGDGIMRVGGRLKRSELLDELKHPIILPRKSHVTAIIIAHCHTRIGHQGRGMTTNEIRAQGFWVIGCSSAVRNHITKCVTCRRTRGPVQEQRMADLPTDRMESAPPFTYVGVDFFGPFVVKEGRKEMKRYGVMFTCLASRAIHIETSHFLTTDSFINALRRFQAIRGPARQIRCDNGTNFVGTRNELYKELSELDQTKIQQFLSSRDCDYVKFTFNVPHASHMGGIWERQIRSARSVLSSLLLEAGTQLDDESLRTLMYEVTAIVNSRPLTVDTLNDPMSLTPLTPNQILTMKSGILLPPPGEFQREDLYSRKRWRRVQHLAEQFWQRWRKEYLQCLQTRQKWNRPRRDMCIGDVVLVRDDNMPRCRWQLGRIVKTYVSDDGHVRSVQLRIGSPPSYLDRPVQKLVLLVEGE